MRILILLLFWPGFVIGQTYAGGIQSMRSPHIIVTQQDITLSIDKVKVSSIYYNNYGTNITETLAFELPHRSEDNFKSLVILVDQKPINYQTIQRAISSRGKDISHELKALRVPFNPIAAMHKIDSSSNRDSIIAKLKTIKAIDQRDDTPTWIVKTYYYWQQEFPAHKHIRIDQTYKPAILSQNIKLNSFASFLKIPVKMVKKIWNVAVHWSKADETALNNLRSEFEKYWPHIQDYCPTQSDYRVLAQAYKKQPHKKRELELKELNFAMDAQNFWANNISQFNLTIESPKNMHPLVCWNEGIKRSQNSLHFTANDYCPLQNINVLYVEK